MLEEGGGSPLHVRLRKKPAWILLVIILLASMLTVRIPPSASKPDNVLSVDPPTIIDETKIPGESFSITLDIDFVENMWGYVLLLSYDTDVLTATSYSSHPVFYIPEPSEIDDDPTVTDEDVGTGDGTKTEFQLDNYPLRPGTETTVYFAVTDEDVGTGDGTTTEFQVEHYPVRTDTGTVYLNVTGEHVGTGDGTTEEFQLDHYPVRSETDTVYLSLTGEEVGTGDGMKKRFQLAQHPVKSGSETVYLDGAVQTRDVDYSIDYEAGEVTFTTAPASGVSVTADYTYDEDNYFINYDLGNFTFMSAYVPEPGVVITADYIHVPTDYAIDYDTGVITFATAPEAGLGVLADYIHVSDIAYTVDYDTGVMTFAAAPEKGVGILADYKYRAYVSMSFHMAFGVPTGYTGPLPDMATIQFTVDDYGWSPLDLHDSVLSTPVGGEIIHEEVDGFFANEIHDVAVTAVTPSATEVTKPEPVYIDVTVLNEGDLTETFDVAAYYDGKPVETKKDVTLDALAEETLTFTWDTTYVNASATYTISANATAVPGEPDIYQDDNTLEDGQVTVNRLSGAPWANFTYSPDRPIERQPVTFNASTSTPDGGNIVNYEWNFDDGNMTETTNPVITHAYDTIGTYTVTLNVTDTEALSDAVMDTVTVYRRDVAVVSVTPQKTEVPRRDKVYIDVTVKNEGDFTETFDVTTYYNETATKWKAITTGSVTELAEGSSKTLSLPWDTADVSPGSYKINATVSAVPGEIDTADNTKVSHIEVTVIRYLHDIAITNVTASPTTVDLGGIVNINVTVANEGDYDETFTVTTSYEDPPTKPQPIEPDPDEDVSLGIGETKIIEFAWNTYNATPGKYLIRAVASDVTGEDDITNNKGKFDEEVTVLGHDIAVTEFEVSPSPILGAHRVTPGETMNITVKVKNQGTSTETFDVTVKYDNHDIDTQTVSELQNGTSKLLTFTWDTTDVAGGTYTLNATATTVPGERPIDTENNALEYGVKVKIGHHDIALINITASPTEVLLGELIFINVTVENQGVFHEMDINVTVRYGDTDIETQIVTRLADGASTTLNFTWDTTDVTPGTYTLKAVVSAVTDELSIHMDDNTFIGPQVAAKVTSTISISANPANITVGETTTINGSITPTRAGVTVTIWYKLSGEETWSNLTAVQTNENSQYSYDWKPTTDGTYEVKASWAGDAGTFEAESDPQTIMVEEAPGPGFVLYAVAGIAIAIVAAAMILYFVKIRKPKPA